MRRVLFLLLLPATLFAQGDFNISVSNLLRYGSGTESVNLFSQKRDYFENLTDVRLGLSDFLVGFRILNDAPPEYGVEFTGIKKRYIEFSRDNLYIRAGDSYSLFGRGLALNLFEQRGLAFDTGVDGLKLDYQGERFKVAATGGDIKYIDVFELVEELYRIRSGSVEVNPVKHLTLGSSYVTGKYAPAHLKPLGMFAGNFYIPELFGRLEFADFDFFVSYAEKRTTDLERKLDHKGTAFYGSISYTGESFGVSMEYKDYRYGIADPYDRANLRRATKAYAFQNAPIVHKEHSFTLLSRYPHVVDFNDEVGAQVDLFYNVGTLYGTLNGAVASRHYSFAPTGDTNQIFQPIYGSVARKNSFLPSFASRYSPFWEIYADWQYYFEEGGSDYIHFGFNRRSEETANEILSPAVTAITIDAVRTTAIPLAIQYTLPLDWAVKFSAERQWVNDNKNLAQSKYYNQLLTLAFSRSPDISFGIRYEFTSDEGTVDDRRDWTAIDFGYRISNKHTVTLTLGGDRGGVVCANGVCRVVNPFLGLRASVVSYF